MRTSEERLGQGRGGRPAHLPVGRSCPAPTPERQDPAPPALPEASSGKGPGTQPCPLSRGLTAAGPPHRGSRSLSVPSCHTGVDLAVLGQATPPRCSPDPTKTSGLGKPWGKMDGPLGHSQAPSLSHRAGHWETLTINTDQALCLCCPWPGELAGRAGLGVGPGLGLWSGDPGFLCQGWMRLNPECSQLRSHPGQEGLVL